MGNAETHHQQNHQQVFKMAEENCQTECGKFGAIGEHKTVLIKYEREEILALRDLPASKAKPECVDDKSFWIGGKPYVYAKTNRRAPGSGRLPYESYNRAPFREKTGREFCEDLLNRQNRTKSYKDINVGYFNPVNKDHRRILEEQSIEEPEWVTAGPTSRFDVVELTGFDDAYDYGRPSSPPQFTQQQQGQQRRPNYNNQFQFDEFLGPEETIFARPNGSRFKRYFRKEPSTAPSFSGGAQQQQHQHQQQPQPNKGGNMLLNLLHGQTTFPETNHGGYSSMSQMPLGDMEMQQQKQLMEQFNANKQFLAERAMIDVLNVFHQQQQRQMLQQRQQSDQVLRMFELHRQIQAANPGLNYQANNPQFWEQIHQRQQAYYQHYQEQGSPRKPTKKNRHVHFSPQSQEERLASFFTPEVVAQASTVKMSHIDAEKAMKVEEFERKIKEVAATCKKPQPN